MKLISILFFVFLGVTLNAQSSKAKINDKGDSTVYYFANIELRNGLKVLTESDSVILNKKYFVSQLATFKAANRVLLLKTAADQIGKDDMKLKNPNETNIIKFYSDLAELKESYNNLKYTNKNSLFYLRDFEFMKELGLMGPGNPVIK